MTVRRYQLTVNNNEYEIDIEEISATEFQVLIDGQTLDVILASQADAADAIGAILAMARALWLAAMGLDSVGERARRGSRNARLLEGGLDRGDHRGGPARCRFADEDAIRP